MLEINFEKQGKLIPVVVQDHETGYVLMLAYMNKEAWDISLATGKATYWSRSRNKLWIKGESSGHVQIIKEVRIDCDLDTVLLKVEQIGKAACHEGYHSCFFRKVVDGKLEIVEEIVFKPEDVYK